MIIALMIGIIVSIFIVGIFFRSPVSAFLPFLMFIFSSVIGAGINGLLYKYIFHTTISFITPTLLPVVELTNIIGEVKFTITYAGSKRS